MIEREQSAEAASSAEPTTVVLEPYQETGVVLSCPLSEGYEVLNKNGVEGEINVLASVDSTRSDSTAVLYEHDGGVGVGILRDQSDNSERPLLEGTKLYKPEEANPADGTKKLYTGAVEISPGNAYVTFSVSPNDGIASVSSYDLDGENMSVNVSSEAKGRKIDTAPKKILRRRRESYRSPSKKSRMAARLGFATMALTSPNSGADIAFDALGDQAAIVSGVGKDVEDTYSHDLEAHSAATQRVKNVIEAIDNKDSAYIEARNSEFSSVYGEVDILKLHRAAEMLDSAVTTSEAFLAANTFLGDYGVSALDRTPKETDIPLSEDDVSALKYELRIALKTVSLFSPEAFEKITTIDTINYVNTPLGGRAAGYTYGPNSKEVTVGMPTPATEILEVIGLPRNDGGILAHEIGHTYSGRGRESDDPPTDYGRPVHMNEEPTPEALLKYYAGRLTRQPSDPSFYGATEIGALSIGHDERFAENFSTLLRLGVPDPNKGYEFRSRLSKQQIAVLIDVESTLPGFSSHLAHEFNQASSLDDPIRSVRDQSAERQALLILLPVLVYGTRKRSVDRERHRIVRANGKVD